MSLGIWVFVCTYSVKEFGTQPVVGREASGAHNLPLLVGWKQGSEFSKWLFGLFA